MDKPIKSKEGPSRTDTAQIHVSFISKQTEALITEETLRSLFGRYGQVVDVSIKKSKFDQNMKVQNGYGFIHYPLTCDGIQSAITATRDVHQITVDRVVYDCTLSHLLESYLTPDQIAFAYSSNVPTSAQRRMTERKRDSSSSSRRRLPGNSFNPCPQTNDCQNDNKKFLQSPQTSLASSSSTFFDEISQWPLSSLTTLNLSELGVQFSLQETQSSSNSSFNSPPSHRRSPSNESSIFSTESSMGDCPADLAEILSIRQPFQSDSLPWPTHDCYSAELEVLGL
jgi:hypothetical protein